MISRAAPAVSLGSIESSNRHVHEAGTPEPHGDREQAGDRNDAPAHPAHPLETQIDEKDAQHDPKHAADGPFHGVEEVERAQVMQRQASAA